jgi:hypothetical protein
VTKWTPDPDGLKFQPIIQKQSHDSIKQSMHKLITIGNMTNEPKRKVVVCCIGKVDNESNEKEKS